MKYRHILFDIDGTLIDTEQMLMSVFSKVLQVRYHYQLTADTFRSTFGIPCDAALRSMGLEPNQEVLDDIQLGIRTSLDLAKVFPQVEPLLNELSDCGVTLGLVTSKNRGEFYSSFVPFGLAHYFSLAICSDDTPRGKPCPDPILYYLSAQRASPRETVYIGDTLYDYQCARQAGVDFILAAWSGISLEAETDTPIAKSVQQLKHILMEV